MKLINMKTITSQKIQVSKAKIYQMINEDKFPKPHKIGGSSLWLEEEVDKIILSILGNVSNEK